MNYSERLNKAIPGGAHTYSRGDDQYPSNAPQILSRGEGAYVFTPEGEKYLDYGMALRAVTLGYGYKSVADAAVDEIHKGNNLTRASVTELIAAEAMCNLVPSADMVKFAKNGSTVTTAAVKIARAYTGKKYIVRCLEHPFFSYDDWFIGDTLMDNGIPSEISSLTLNFHYNDIASLKELFANYRDQIACVILEPSTTVGPKDDFLGQIKRLCKENNALFILDEMITGFRMALPGAQTYFDIEPDLSTFGKGISNGFSVAALMGKREIMELGGIKSPGAKRLFLVSTTHGAEMCGLGALIETIRVYQESNVIDHLWSYGGKLMSGMNIIAAEFGIADQFYIEGYPCSLNFATNDRDGKISLGLRTLFCQEMIKGGVLMPWIALSYSHKDAELQKTLEATRKALRVYACALTDGVSKYLDGPVIKPVFRKIN